MNCIFLIISSGSSCNFPDDNVMTVSASIIEELSTLVKKTQPTALSGV